MQVKKENIIQVGITNRTKYLEQITIFLEYNVLIVKNQIIEFEASVKLKLIINMNPDS